MTKKNANFKDEISAWPAARRTETAKKIVRALTDKILEVIDLASNCEYFVYKDTLAKQIPPSHAGHAFLSVQDALFRQLVVRTVAIWDPAETNAISIPTAIELIDDPAVIHSLQEEHFDAHADRGFRNLNPSDDPDLEQAIQAHFNQSQKDFAATQAEKADAHLLACIEAVRDLERDKLIVPIRNLRDHISHSLIRTRREISAPVQQMKYGEERDLREKSILLIQDLYTWVNGVGFDIAGDCVEQADRNAKDLWERCILQFD